jgi:hypothetical protein
MYLDPIELPYDYYMVFESACAVMPTVGCLLRSYNWGEGSIEGFVKMTWTQPPLAVQVDIGSVGPGRTTVSISAVNTGPRTSSKGRPEKVSNAISAALLTYLADWQTQIDADTAAGAAASQ